MKRLTRLLLAALLVVTLTFSACSANQAEPGGGTSAAAASGALAGSPSSLASAAQAAVSTAGTVFDPSTVHTFSMTVDAADLEKMLQTYVDSGDKKWITVTLTIDGTTFTHVGARLKGNSSLRGVTVDSQPETLPWRIRLDKYVDGQNIDGYSDFDVRSNSSTTSINEAVALDLLGDAGLATEHAVETAFSVNGSEAALRLTIQNLDSTWVAQNFPDAGKGSILYKSDADGDWSWRGTGGDYTSSFDIKSGPDDYAPLIKLLDLLHNGATAEITKELPDLVDVPSFATYLAFENLIGNFDDIDGPGNNSYLFWDSATKKFTVVAWDHNLAFGGAPGGGAPGGGGRAGGGARAGGTADDDNRGRFAPPAGAVPSGAAASGAVPSGAVPPSGAVMAGGAPGEGGPGGKDNPLVDAFNANSAWKALETNAQSTLKAQLITSGALGDSVGAWVKTLTDSATGLVAAGTISSDADKVRAFAEK